MRRLGAALAWALWAGLAWGQAGVVRAIEQGLGPEQVASGKPARPASIANPLQPSGFGGLPPKHADEPPEKPPENAKRQIEILEAARLSYPGNNIVEIEGPAHVRTQGYDIYADKVVGNLKTKVYILRGNAKLVSEQGVIVGQYIEADLANERYRTEDSEADLRPALLQGKAKGDLYLKAQKTEGDRRKVVSYNGSLTTCNLEHPHYDLEADRIDITPYDEAVLRRVRIKVLDRTLIGLPRITVPLKENADRYLPDVGESSEEGYYIKTRYGIDLGRKDGFDARLDYMTRLGAGIGGDYKYNTAKSKGRLQLYGVTGGKNYYTYSVNHLQNFGKNTFGLDSSLQHKNYFNAPDSTIWSVRTYYRILQEKSATQLSFYQSVNEASRSNSSSRTLGIADTRNFPSLFRTNASVDWVVSENKYGTNPKTERQQVNVRFNAQKDLKRANAILEYQRSIPVGDTINFINAADRTPVFTLQSSDTRLFGKRSAIPFQTELSIGEFTDSLAKRQITRQSFLFTFGSSPSGRFDSGYLTLADYSQGFAGRATDAEPPSGPPLQNNKPDMTVPKPSRQGRVSFDYNGRFKQGIYSDDTAQYTTGLNTNAGFRIGRDFSMNIRYNYLDSHGYSPLSIDRQGRSNIASVDLDGRIGRSFTVAAGTGYDFFQDTKFGQSKWQMVNMRTDWTPAEWFQLRSYSSYDTSLEKLSSVRFDIGYKPGATFVGAGAKYDGIRHTWGALSLFVDGLKVGRLKVSSLLIYNGYIKKFEARHFSFTYDLHCAEAIFQILDNPVGYRPGTQYVLMIRLKAFPFNTPFGTGSTGQSLGLGFGRGGY